MYKAHIGGLFILFIIINLFTLFILLTSPSSQSFELNFPIAKTVLLYNLIPGYVSINLAD
ncbi:hypothetical protein SAMN05428975_1099 [Mucilaginibacter sp. OK268]|nr:hypothetical protein SAMN05428975_1099 [Mucilaginibacter sp. OK268]